MNFPKKEYILISPALNYYHFFWVKYISIYYPSSSDVLEFFKQDIYL